MTLLGAIQQLHEMRSDDNFPFYYKPAIDKVIETILMDAQEVRHGRWIGYNADKEDWKRTDGSPVFISCSECHGTVLNNGSAYWRYCPNCGSRMDLEGEEDEQNG